MDQAKAANKNVSEGWMGGGRACGGGGGVGRLWEGEGGGDRPDVLVGQGPHLQHGPGQGRQERQ